jgi:two-component system, chemotaxis family, protein-glutamate methylesterase/glutaminase
MSARPIRVLIVDDSALARRAIREALADDPQIEVVGEAADPYLAREAILTLEPDVLTLDLEMPRMDGLTFLKILAEHHPIPVVVVSALTPAGSVLALAALEAGAIDVIQKPDGRERAASVARRIATQVKAAAHAARRRPGVTAEDMPGGAPPVADPDRRVVVIGASTGGVQALRYLLPRLPAGLPPIVVVQHIPAIFSRTMAQHLDALVPYTVKEASANDALTPGLCLIAPGDHHVVLEPRATGFGIRLTETPPVNHCRPSVDVLFRSTADVVGAGAVGVLLTGMGSDGARGLALLRSVGARTLAQSEDSCVVFGMPQAAIRLGAVERVVSLERMPGAILAALARRVDA